MSILSRDSLVHATVKIREAFCDRLFRFHSYFQDTVTAPTKQGRLTMSTRDLVIARHLFCTGQYEFDSSVRTLRFLKSMKFIPEQDVRMFDIGANIGIISIGLLLAKEIAGAVAIEPEPKNFDLLIKNVKQNGLSEKLCCLQMAVGEAESRLTMEISPHNLGDHRVRTTPTQNASERENESSRGTIEVPSLPLQRILDLPEVKSSAAAYPSLIWLDVQGYEGYVFSGSKELFRSGIPTVSEIWPYGIHRAGMSMEQYASVVGSIWSEYWIERRNRYIRYPMAVFNCYLDEIGSTGHFENVIFTNGKG